MGKPMILVPILGVLAVLILLAAILVPAVIARLDKAERIAHPEKFATSWTLIRSEQMNVDTQVVFYKDNKSGNEIACVYGRLANAPSCFLTGNKITAGE